MTSEGLARHLGVDVLLLAYHIHRKRLKKKLRRYLSMKARPRDVDNDHPLFHTVPDKHPTRSLPDTVSSEGVRTKGTSPRGAGPVRRLPVDETLVTGRPLTTAPVPIPVDVWSLWFLPTSTPGVTVGASVPGPENRHRLGGAEQYRQGQTLRQTRKDEEGRGRGSVSTTLLITLGFETFTLPKLLLSVYENK